MTKHAVVIAGGGPTGLMLSAELALARVDVAIVERRDNQDLEGSRAGGLHSRTIEVLDQRGIADRFLSQGKVMQVAGFAMNPLDISDFPTRHNYGLALWQEGIERILAAWVDELAVPIYREREVTGFAQEEDGIDATERSQCGRLRGAPGLATAARQIFGRRSVGDGEEGRDRVEALRQRCTADPDSNGAAPDRAHDHPGSLGQRGRDPARSGPLSQQLHLGPQPQQVVDPRRRRDHGIPIRFQLA